MKKHINSIVIFAILIVIGFTLAACPLSPSSDEDDTIVFWTTMGPPSYDYLNEIVNNYNDSQSAMKVKLVHVNDSSTNIDDLLNAINDGKAPDIYMLDRFTVAQRAADGILQDLTPYLVGMLNTHDYQNFAIEETQFRGRTYAIPFDADIRGLYYNKAMIPDGNLVRAGDTIKFLEALNYQNGPITLDELKEIARSIDAKESGNYAKAGFIPQMDQGNPYTWGYCFGGEFADSDRTQVTPDDPKIIAAFNFLYNWSNDMGITQVQSFLSNYNYFNDPEDYANHPFIKGDIAMTINGDWFMDVIKEYAPDIEYGVTYIPVPQAGDKPSTWAGGYAWGIPKGSNKTAEALKFIAYGCSRNGQRIYCKDYNKAPTLYSLAIEDGFYAPEQPYFQEIISSAKIRPPLPVGASYWDALCEAQNEVVNGTSPATALGNVKTKIQPMLDEILLK